VGGTYALFVRRRIGGSADLVLLTRVQSVSAWINRARKHAITQETRMMSAEVSTGPRELIDVADAALGHQTRMCHSQQQGQKKPRSLTTTD
jgi:hypothetical protein